MQDFTTMNETERQNLGDGKPADYTSALEGKVSMYDYDEALKATIETTTNGERYIVELRNSEMVRTQKLQ
jgi:hypothetical protein